MLVRFSNQLQRASGCGASQTHVLFIDLVGLKNPSPQALHWGWVVGVPTAIVYLPNGHIVWPMQESVLMLLRDVNVFMNPGGQIAHLGCVIPVPNALVYLPEGHLVWTVQESVLRSL